MEAPLISIILPVYNGQSFLREAIESCLNQTYEKIELIIVNDCSTDDTLKIAREYGLQDGRIRIITNKKNKNLPASLNIGHRAASGALITWTSDDNIYHKNALRRMMKVLSEREVDFVYSSYLLINEQGDVTGVSKLKDIEYLMFYGIIGACFLYKKEVYLRNNGYNENLFLLEDQDFWLRALKHSSWSRIDEPGLYLYRYHTESLTIKIKSDPIVRARFLKSLNFFYNDFFRDIEARNKKILVAYMVARYLEGAYCNIIPLREKKVFKNLRSVTSSLNGFSSEKLNKIIFRDAVEALLRNRKYQTISGLRSIHSIERERILELPIKRYFAVLKKCLF